MTKLNPLNPLVKPRRQKDVDAKNLEISQLLSGKTQLKNTPSEERFIFTQQYESQKINGRQLNQGK